MANILSQEEVDALLGAVERGELVQQDEEEDSSGDGYSVVEYNFRRPNLITKDELRLFNNLHENFARELQGALSLLVRSNSDVDLVSTDQAQYNEFMISLSDITHLILFNVNPLPGLVVMEVNLSLIYGIVDLLLGGKGDVETEIRKLSEVELAITEPFMKKTMEQLQLAWQKVMPVEIKEDRFESSPEYVQAAPSDAPMIVLTFDVKVGLANGIINLCYPMPMVQTMLDRMNGRSLQIDTYYGSIDATGASQKLEEALQNVPMTIRAELGSARIRARDLIALRKGDVLILDEPVSSSLLLAVDDQPLFIARPGRSNRHLAVKVTRKVEPEEAYRMKIERE